MLHKSDNWLVLGMSRLNSKGQREQPIQ